MVNICENKIISIIIPFYNRPNVVYSAWKNLLKYDDKHIEFVIIDDGSDDNTLKNLIEIFAFKFASLKIVSQLNKGPGGARNEGVRHAKGRYIWFVDSDDDISYDVFNNIKNLEKTFDIISFNYKTNGTKQSGMDIPIGENIFTHNDLIGIEWKSHCTKLYSREFWIKNKVEYPEYTFYEDNFLPFVLPFCVRTIYKIDVVGYVYNTMHESITRSGVSFRKKDFGRLVVAYEGYLFAINKTENSNSKEKVIKYFIQLYLINTIGMLLSNVKASKKISLFFLMKKIFDSTFFILKDQLDKKSVFKIILNSTNSQKIRYLFQIFIKLPNSNTSVEEFIEINKKAWGK